MGFVAGIEENGQQPTGRDNTKWQRAEQFLATVRDKQRHRDGGMRGGRWLSETELAPIQRAWEDTHTIHAAAAYLDDTGGVARQLFDYLGEMCRRNEVVVPSEISREVHFILAVELLANMEDLDAPPAKLIAATTQHGVLGLGKNPQFLEAFADRPSMFTKAAVGYSADPEGFLARVLAKIDELEQDDRFASLRDRPGIFTTAASSYTTDPEGYLSGVLAKIDELERDDRFASLRDRPGMFTKAASEYADPEGYLSGVIAKIAELERDDRFASLRDWPSVFKAAAAGYSDPEGFLSGVLAKIDELEQDDRFASLRDRPSIFTRAASGYADPEGYLSGVLAKIDELEQDDRFASLRDRPSIFTKAASGYADPEQFLFDVMEDQARKRITGRNGKAHAHDGPAR